MKHQAKRMEEIPFSNIRKFMDRATELEQEGKNIIHLEIGRPDFDTPQNIKDAANRALAASKVFYTSNYGIIELRKAIVEKLEKDNGLKYDVGEIMVTAGLAEGIFVALLGLLDEGDEVLVPSPVWLNYVHISKMAGATPVFYGIKEENDFQIDIDELRSKITPKTKMLVLISPNNPTGGVLSASMLEEVAKVAVEHDLLVLSDEIYEKIVFDGVKHVSVATFPGMKERTIVMNGFSKIYSMTGWRLGYVAAPKELISILVRAHQYNAASASSISQWAGVEALENSDEAVAAMQAEYQRRKDFIVPAINAIPHLSCVPPKGSFYIFVNIKELGISSEEAAFYFLEECGVSTIPGTTFGEEGEGYIRVSFAASYESLVEAADRFRKGVERLMQSRGR